MLKNGFTLVEVLVVMAILSIVGVLVLTIFTKTLQGTNKSQIISSIKQNGQLALENIDKTIRNADAIVCTSSNDLADNYHMIATVKDGIYTTFRFTPPGNQLQCGSKNGCIIEDVPFLPSPPPTANAIKVFNDGLCSSPLENPQILTDTNTKTGVSILNGSFDRKRQPGSKDSITVKFDLKPGVEAPSALSGQIDPVSFETTIQLR